jgi:hypothetical protein
LGGAYTESLRDGDQGDDSDVDLCALDPLNTALVEARQFGKLCLR